MKNMKQNMSTEEHIWTENGYSQVADIGKGTYAKVKSALWRGKSVAVKIIDTKNAREDFVRRFLPREIKILGEIRHPNIISVYEIGRKEGIVWITMELAKHDLLQKIKRDRRICEIEAQIAFRQLLEAIHYLHQNGIAHRDIKCENILLDQFENVKLTDFGFARKMSPGVLSKTFCGSNAYAAPEILLGIPYSDFAMDIWSMGIVLYVMITGQMPFDDRDTKSMIAKQKHRQVKFSKNIPLSSQVKCLVTKLLEPKSPQRIDYQKILRCGWLRHGVWHMRNGLATLPYAIQTDQITCADKCVGVDL